METKMLRWTAGVTRLDRIRNNAIWQKFGVAPIADKMRDARSRRDGHVREGRMRPQGAPVNATCGVRRLNTATSQYCKARGIDRMSYETISVRMNRSDPGIGWGFTLRQHGGKLVVGSVDRDSLSDKAGMKPDDEVDAVCGRNAKNMGINEANSIIDNSYQEVNFNLRR
ncbi:unnamed protein product [Heligmosomoides polygyrus]|uniref:PDZ domain-containing protein n=1 Tax=Heligmosomoides polygyrus TaxID=6339 RepID=A0A183G9F0_HELPZ|nr:unnamed protein product [Heligmosomoides polygyrus]